MKKITLCTAALTAALGLGGLAVSAGSASAAVVCNAAGDCWHVDHRDRYPGVALTYHPDDWYFHRHWDNDRDHHWRDYHEGRGYYDHGVWVPR
ncbi:hypothetical protein [Phenylobacterium sp.]|jgi:hypothetical protein|uniref:hypothetical protein n=1 Tax=Phenylobacterium sp. TaxID=1871053 RepID=UPI002E37887B|nr:hypothetical protein [Phenylobacterium sp.]HEX3367621.1 hypothetical protein [Phenylobacterium sp.]